MIPDSLAVRFGKWVVDNPWKTIILSVLLAAAAASGARFIEFTTDYRAFFSEDNPELRTFERLENTYTKSDNVLIVLTPGDGGVFSRETLAAVEDLTREAWQTPYSIRVDSVTNFQYTSASGDDLVVRDLVTDAGQLSAAEIEHVERVALNEPLLVNQLVDPEGTVTAVNITVQTPGINPTRETPEVVDFMRELVRDFEADHPGIEVRLTGIVMLNYAFSEASQTDMKTLIPISFLVIVVSIGLLLRGWAGTVASVWVIVFSVAAAMGLTGWLGIRLTPPSATAPLMILTMAVADSVHVLTSFYHAARRGEAKKAALVESLRINLQPIFLTSITTAIGFLSMNFSDAPPFRDLGNIVAMGVMAAFVLSVGFLPALMSVSPVKVRPEAQGRSPVMERFAELVIARRGVLLYGVGGLILLLVAFIPRNELNDVYVEYFDHSVPFRTATDYTTDNLTGLYRIDYSVESGESGGVSDPGFMRQVGAFTEWLRGQPEVMFVGSYTDIMKRLNRNMHGDDPDYYSLPEGRELAAQYLLLYEMSLPYGLDLNNQINVDKSATRVSVSLQTLSVNEVLAFTERADQWLDDNTPGLAAEAGGPSVMFSHIGRRNIHSMLLGTSVALVLISMILVVALRSVRMGLVSLVPNLVPAAMAFGVWGMLVGEVGLSLSVVMGMTLGIVVDDTVHFLSKYLRARRERGLSPPESVRYAFRTVGTALWVTSLVLMAGFLVLTLSAFKPNSGMGLMTAITIGLALIADFLFLPPLLMKIEEKTHANTASDSTAAEPASA